MAYNPEQANAALAKAVNRRVQRGALRRALKAGEVRPRDVLAGDAPGWEEVVAATKLEVLLLMIPGVGPLTAAEAIAELGVDAKATLGGLGRESRRRLAELMGYALNPVETPIEPDHSWRT